MKKTKNWSEADTNVSAKFPVVHPLGLHTRPAAAIVKIAKRFPAVITLKKGPLKVDGKSMLEVLTLEARQGEIIEIFARGLKAKEALVQLGQLFQNGFHE